MSVVYKHVGQADICRYLLRSTIFVTINHLFIVPIHITQNVMNELCVCMYLHVRIMSNQISMLCGNSAFMGNIYNIPGISVTAPIRRSTPWAFIRNKFPFIPTIEIATLFSFPSKNQINA